MNDIMLALQDGETGPCTLDQVRWYLHHQQATMNTQFWRPGMKTWKPLASIRSTLLQTPSSVPTMTPAMAQQRHSRQVETQYWIERSPGAEADGPFLMEQLREQWKTGSLRVNMRYYTEDLGDWLSVQLLIQDMKAPAEIAVASRKWVPAPESDVSRATYVLLALFFGTLGIHNFLAGYNGRGIAQLLLSLTGIGLAITIPWSIIEACSETQDSKGRRMT